MLTRKKKLLKVNCGDCENVGYYDPPFGRCIPCRERVEYVRSRGWVPFYVRVNHTVAPFYVVGFARTVKALPVEMWGNVETLRVYARPSSYNRRCGGIAPKKGGGRCPQFIADLLNGIWIYYPRERVDNASHAR